MNSEAPPLSSYLLAGFPCLSFQSTEDDRVIDYIKSSCIEANEFSDSTPYAIFKWTCIDGIQISSDGLPPGSVLPDTIKIGGDTKDLRHAFITFKSVTRDTPTVGIFLNVRKYLDNPLVIQSLKDAATTLRKQGSHIILVGPLGDVPDELRAIVTELDFRLPDRDRLQVLYKDLVESYSGVLDVKGDINDRIKKAAEAAIGMTELEAENALALSMTESNDIDIQLIQQEKARAVKKSDVLEWFPSKEKMSDVGDADNLKKWVEKRKNIFNDSAVEYGLPIPKGLLLLGIPGTGKSLVSKAIAGYLGLPLIRFDIGSLFKKYVGESIHGESEIYIASNTDGFNVKRLSIRRAYQINATGYTLSYTDHGGFKWSKINAVLRHNRKEQFIKITTELGYSLVVTEGHSLFKRNPSKIKSTYFNEIKGKPDHEGGKLIPAEAKDLKIGDKIAISKHIICDRHKRPAIIERRGFKAEITEDIAFLIGLWMADGCFNGNALRLCCSIKEPEIVSFVKSLGQTCNTKKWYNGRYVGIDYTVNGRQDLVKLFNFLCIADKSSVSTKKRMPEWALGMPSNIVAKILSGYFSGDGSVNGHNIEVESISYNLIMDVAMLLRRFGIVANISYRKANPLKKIRGKVCNYHDSWRITISRVSDHVKFIKNIGFAQKHKNEKIKKNIAKYERIPGKFSKRSRYSIMWDNIVSVEHLDSADKYSYDLSVDGTEKFVSNGIIAHNSELSVRNALRTIEAISPVVVHFDELEKGFAGVNSGGDSGVGSRVLGTILTWMQERSTMSFIVATVNNVELLPAELYRAGRFDKVFATDLPGQQGREEIYRIHIKKRKRDPKKYDIRTIAAKSVGFVGAEIEYVVEEAMFDAFADNGREFTTQDLLTAIENVIPMSKRDREKIEVIRAFCKERATPVSAGEKKSVTQKSTSSTRRVAAKKLIKKVRGGK